MKRTRIRPMSVKRAATRPLHAAVREIVFGRDVRCVLASRPETGRCWGALTPHHILKASQGGSYTPGNLITLCAHHNGTWVEGNPLEAHALGLVIRHGDTPEDARDRRRAHGIGPWDLGDDQ